MTTPRLHPSVLVFIVLVLFVLYSSCYIVSQTEYALVTQFGNPVAIDLKPGLKFKVPFTQSVEYFDNRLLEYYMPDEIEINASDEKRIRLEAFLRWRITDPLVFARATRAAGIGGNRIQTMNNQLNNLLGSSLRQVIGNVPLSALLSPERDHIMTEIRELVTHQALSADAPPADDDSKPGTPPHKAAETKSGYGIQVVDVRIVKADLPPENSEAVFKRMQTERKQEATTYRAKGAEEGQVIKANADRDKTVLLAEAQKKSEILRGEGDALASKIYADAFGKDPEFFEFYRSMQAYSKALDSKNTTLVLSPDDAFLKEFSNTPKR